MENNNSIENGNHNLPPNPMEFDVETSTSTSYDPNLISNQTPDWEPDGILIGFFLVFVILMIAMYIYFSMAFQRMAQKINIPDDWYAWVPGLNLVLIFKIANRPLWWMIFLVVPIISIIISIIVWMDVAKAMRKPEWLGILIVVPFVNLVIPGYLAFSKDTVSQQQGVGSGEKK